MFFADCTTITILSCNGYAPEASTRDMSDVAGLCALLEEQAGDGFARVASREGQLFADSEGFWERHGLSSYERLERAFDAY